MSRSLEQQAEEKDSLVSSKPLYKGKIISLRIDTVKKNDKLYTWDIVEHPGASVIIPVDEKGNLLLIKQWRRAVGEVLIEFPAGTLDDGEDPLDCAKRELQEETGYKANEMISLGGFYTVPGFCTEYLYFFLGRDLEKSPLPHDETEAIDLFPLSLSEALDKIDNREICDAKTIAGIFWYLRWKEKHGEHTTKF